MIEWDKVRYFRRNEFGHHLGVEPDEALVMMLDDARLYAGRPFFITSGIRSPKVNSEVGGSPKSAHLTGHAVDIRCTSDNYRWHMVDALTAVGFRRIGVYDHHIHVDTDPTKPQDRLWLGLSS